MCRLWIFRTLFDSANWADERVGFALADDIYFSERLINKKKAEFVVTIDKNKFPLTKIFKLHGHCRTLSYSNVRRLGSKSKEKSDLFFVEKNFFGGNFSKFFIEFVQNFFISFSFCPEPSRDIFLPLTSVFYLFFLNHWFLRIVSSLVSSAEEKNERVQCPFFSSFQDLWTETNFHRSWRRKSSKRWVKRRKWLTHRSKFFTHFFLDDKFNRFDSRKRSALCKEKEKTNIVKKGHDVFLSFLR